MTDNSKQKQFLNTSNSKRALALMFAVASLSSCYVEVVQDDFYAHSDYHDVTDFNTRFLVDAALIPLALAAESPHMVIDPDAYTTPHARELSRAAVIETTYAYLFEDLDCDYGGFTQSEAEANTTSFDDGFTSVELTLNADAFNCEVESGNRIYTINSDIRYNVDGEYDDWESELSDIEAGMSGEAQLEYRDQLISHSNISASVFDYSATDFGIQANSRLLLDDGLYIESTDFNTHSSVHWYLYDDHPHNGSVRIKDGNDWVTLSFERNGLYREDSSGYRTYWSWSQLGY